MRTLILAAGRFGESMREAIASGREPRLDVFELARVLDADVIDYLDAERSESRAVRLAAKTLGLSAAVATLGFAARSRYDAMLTTGEDIGLPLSGLLTSSRNRCSHTMIAHTLLPAKKRLFFRLHLADRIDRYLVYSTSEEQHATQNLGVPPSKMQRIYYHADEQFFTPTETGQEPRLVCAAGQLLRDYDTLIDAVRGRDIRVQIAAGSP